MALTRTLRTVLTAALVVLAPESVRGDQVAGTPPIAKVSQSITRTAQPMTSADVLRMEASLPRLAGAMPGSIPLRRQLAKQPLLGTIVDPRIVGGELAGPLEARWQVALVATGYPVSAGFFCGGSLIASSWVVTAAHCVEKTSPSQIKVYTGSRSLKSGGRTTDVVSITVHEGWNRDTMANDIALLKLSSELELERGTTELVELADAPITAGFLGFVTGWGATTEGGLSSEQLRKVAVPTIDIIQCNAPNLYDGAISAGMICAGVSGLDSCQGDSGGPFSTNLQSGAKLLGVVSWGEGCARPNRPGVYTDVSYFREWIRGASGV